VEQGTGNTVVFDPSNQGLSPIHYVSVGNDLWTRSPIPGEFDVEGSEHVVIESDAGTTIELLPLLIRYDNFAVGIDFEYLGSGDIAFDRTVDDDVLALKFFRMDGAVLLDMELLLDLHVAFDLPINCQIMRMDIVGDGSALGDGDLLAENTSVDFAADGDDFGCDVSVDFAGFSEDDLFFDLNIPFDHPVDMEGAAPFDIAGDGDTLRDHCCTDAG